jgi:hypothetical protein
VHVDKGRNEIWASSGGWVVEEGSGKGGVLSMDLMAAFKNSGTVLMRPATIELHFLAATERPMFGDVQTLTIVADGKSVASGATRIIKSDCTRGECEEGVRGPSVPLAVIEQIVVSKVTEFHFGAVTLTMGPDAREALRDLVTLAQSKGR